VRLVLDEGKTVAAETRDLGLSAVNDWRVTIKAFRWRWCARHRLQHEPPKQLLRQCRSGDLPPARFGRHKARRLIRTYPPLPRYTAPSAVPEQYDVITTFDVIHDAVDPRALLRSIRQALHPDGVYVCLDINCSERLEENAGPLGAMFHGFSVFYCMTTSLANGGVGLGTVGLHEPKVRELCAEAGFTSIRRVPLENPFNNLYEVRP
jgi:SAM-dependent methyltransferase